MLTLGNRCGQRAMGDGATPCSGSFLENPDGPTSGQTDFAPSPLLIDEAGKTCAGANNESDSCAAND
jgi:hypothetical protein